MVFVELLGHLCLCFSSNLGKFSIINFSDILSAQFRSFASGTPTMHMLVHCFVSYRFLTMFIFLLSVFFLFLRLDNFHCSVFKLDDSFVCLNLPLNPFSEFLLDIELFVSRISFLVSLCIFSFIDISVLST